MFAEPEMQYAGVLLVGREGDLLLQQRDIKPGINSPGAIGVFGGGVESGENLLTCALREVAEETGLDLTPGDVRPLTRIWEPAWHGGPREVAYFLAVDVDAESLVITEGRLFRMPLDRLGELWPLMTGSASFAVRLYLERFRREHGMTLRED